MKEFNICIDIDGTITDPYYWLSPANRYFNRNVKPEQVTQYSIDQILGVSRKEYIEFYNKNKFIMHDREKIRGDARNIICKLFNISNIYFVTARDKDLEILTYNYLNRYKIPYDELLLLGSPYKVKVAEKLECDVFIEDSPENAIQLSQSGFKVILLDTNYNRQVSDDNVFRVFNWNGVYEIIEKMLLQSKVV
ncbi:hypothetical protein KM800_03450 [Clostridium tyrobutyricum]|uniref:5' nucleotidase, NT5C type n=1 Tax=Clostridium tyrobutyricum TaxID=1519 RepID=UPI001C38E89F|nr:hypothetical protein [Clostridium tyrobutyricum]MBV4418387.1 hypothetical protein [Clostridium tyrobutyricum]